MEGQPAPEEPQTDAEKVELVEGVIADIAAGIITETHQVYDELKSLGDREDFGVIGNTSTEFGLAIWRLQEDCEKTKI